MQIEIVKEVRGGEKFVNYWFYLAFLFYNLEKEVEVERFVWLCGKLVVEVG